MLEKDLVYELFKDKDRVCESYIWCVFLEKLNSLNKDSHSHRHRRASNLGGCEISALLSSVIWRAS